MADRYIWDGSAQDDSDSTWNSSTIAYLTFQLAITAASAGDNLFVHAGSSDPHVESDTTDKSITLTVITTDNPINIYAVDKNNSDAAIIDPETPGVPLWTLTGSGSDFILMSPFRWHGCWLRAGRNISVCGPADGLSEAHNCRFDVGWESTSGQFRLDETKDASFHMYGGKVYFGDGVSTGAGNIAVDPDGWGEFYDVSFHGTDLRLNELISMDRRAHLIFAGCDFSDLPDASGDEIIEVSGDHTSAYIKFISCILPTNMDIAITNTAKVYVDIINSDTGDNLYRTERHRLGGDCKTDSGVTHTGGFTDETGSGSGTLLSHKMTPAAACVLGNPVEGPQLTAYVASTGSKTFTVQGVENFTTALQNDEAWMDVYALETASKSLWGRTTTRVVPKDTVADLTTGDALSTWTSEPAGSRSIKFASTITVNHIGYFGIKIHLGKFESGKVLHYDPKVVVT